MMNLKDYTVTWSDTVRCYYCLDAGVVPIPCEDPFCPASDFEHENWVRCTECL